MSASGFTLGESQAGQKLLQLQSGKSQGGFGPRQTDGGKADGSGGHRYPLPQPRDLVLLEMALEKLDGRDKEKVSAEEAQAVKRVCWENAQETAQRLCQAGEQRDYPSTALRRLLQRVYQRVGQFSEAGSQEDAWGSYAALHNLAPEIFHLARTTTKAEVKKFFLDCGQLAKNLADQVEPRRPTGRGLAVFLERVICFAEHYAVEQELEQELKSKKK